MLLLMKLLAGVLRCLEGSALRFVRVQKSLLAGWVQLLGTSGSEGSLREQQR
jgi:hypothetical protein